MTELLGKWALVTGGATRVGECISRYVLDAGCHLIVHYASNEKGARRLVRNAKEVGRRVEPLQADLCDRGEIEGFVSRVKELCGGELALVVNNAGNFERTVPHELGGSLAAQRWDRAMELNATAPYLLTVGLVDCLRRGRGSMVAVGCVSALKPYRNYVPYGCSKAALLAVVRGLAVAFAPDVRVNAVAPGIIDYRSDGSADEGDVGDTGDTDACPNAFGDPGGVPSQAMLDRIALRRFGTADDIAGAVLFLARNDYITGQTIVVDGGLMLS